MKFVFVHLPPFASKARKLRLTLEDFREIENVITTGPERSPVVSGSGGLRKMRFAPAASGGGKSGALRICYFLIDEAARVYLVTLFSKSEKSNLSPGDIREIASLIASIKARHRSEP